jgi:DNA repair exonuclease SbcCD nuclease subunit
VEHLGKEILRVRGDLGIDEVERQRDIRGSLILQNREDETTEEEGADEKDGNPDEFDGETRRPEDGVDGAEETPPERWPEKIRRRELSCRNPERLRVILGLVADEGASDGTMVQGEEPELQQEPRTEDEEEASASCGVGKPLFRHGQIVSRGSSKPGEEEETPNRQGGVVTLSSVGVRILFLSDTHLGIDLPSRPRVERRRRGDDFFESFERAIEPAIRGETDVVVHGGDLFYRSRVPAWLAGRVFERLEDLADSGVDVFWVPGNHERSVVPRGLLLTHPNVRVFDRPRTFTISRRGLDLALSGFPYTPGIRDEFMSLVAATGHLETRANVRLLCIHQLVEGARVGPVDFTFRSGHDVVRGADVPPGFAAILSGHVHRFQVLERDLAGRRLLSPVLYPGSIERTSFAERHERKGFLVLEVVADLEAAGGSARWEFRELPVRPMVDVDLDAGGVDASTIGARLRDSLSRLDPASVVRIRLLGTPSPEALRALGAAALRSAAPETMSVTLAWRDASPVHGSRESALRPSGR